MTRRDFVSAVQPFAVTIREPAINAGDIEMEAYQHNQLVVVRKDTLAIIAVIDRDNFYDRDGNRFNY